MGFQIKKDFLFKNQSKVRNFLILVEISNDKRFFRKRKLYYQKK